MWSRGWATPPPVFFVKTHAASVLSPSGHEKACGHPKTTPACTRGGGVMMQENNFENTQTKGDAVHGPYTPRDYTKHKLVYIYN